MKNNPPDPPEPTDDSVPIGEDDNSDYEYNPDDWGDIQDTPIDADR